MQPFDKVLIGNVVIYAKQLRDCLKKSHYWLVYHDETITLMSNHGGGGEQVLEIRNASYESAVKLADQLGLKQSGSLQNPTEWSKWNPFIGLVHDGSADADKLLLELAKRHIPYRVVTGNKLTLIDNGRYEREGGWTQEKMLEMVRETATRYREQLKTSP